MSKVIITIEVEGENISVTKKEAKSTEVTKREKSEVYEKEEEKFNLGQKIAILGAIVNEIARGDDKKAQVTLSQYGTFEAQDGTLVKGYRTLSKLKEYSQEKGEKWLNVTLANATKDYIETFSQQEYDDILARVRG